MRAVIKTESDFDPRVVSSAGAQGLMQLMPETARLMGVTDIFDPRQNIMGGARYLQVLARRFCKTPARGRGGRRALTVCSPEEKVKVIAGYHAGPAAVEKYGGMPPYETTHAYVGDGAAPLRRSTGRRRRERSRGATEDVARRRARAVCVAHLASAGELVAAKKFGEAEGEILRALSASPERRQGAQPAGAGALQAGTPRGRARHLPRDRGRVAARRRRAPQPGPPGAEAGARSTRRCPSWRWRCASRPATSAPGATSATPTPRRARWCRRRRRSAARGRTRWPPSSSTRPRCRARRRRCVGGAALGGRWRWRRAPPSPPAPAAGSARPSGGARRAPRRDGPRVAASTAPAPVRRVACRLGATPDRAPARAEVAAGAAAVVRAARGSGRRRSPAIPPARRSGWRSPTRRTRAPTPSLAGVGRARRGSRGVPPRRRARASASRSGARAGAPFFRLTGAGDVWIAGAGGPLAAAALDRRRPLRARGSRAGVRRLADLGGGRGPRRRACACCSSAAAARSRCSCRRTPSPSRSPTRQPTLLSAARLYGWVGRLVPHGERMPGAAPFQLGCQGEGVVLLEAIAPASYRPGSHGQPPARAHQRPEPGDDGAGGADPVRALFIDNFSPLRSFIASLLYLVARRATRSTATSRAAAARSARWGSSSIRWPTS